MTKPEAERLPALVLTLLFAVVSFSVAVVVSANSDPSEGAMPASTGLEGSATPVPLPPGYVQQPPYLGACPAQPLVCIGFSDGYKWLISDTIIQGQRHDGEWYGARIEVSIGFRADYYHVVRTSYVRQVAKPYAVGPNLLTNPGFESGLAGWHSTAELNPPDSATFGPDALDTHSGAQSATGRETLPGNLGRLYQDVTAKTVAGRLFKIGGWVKAEGATGPVVIGLDYVSAGGWTPSAPSYVKEVGYVSGTRDWTYFESDVFTLPPMPEGVGNAALWFLFDFNGGSGHAWWDDVFLVEVGRPLVTPPGTGDAGLASERR